MDRVTNISWQTASGATLGGFAYEYDALGHITSRSHALGTNAFDRVYAYDDFDRLATDGDVAYTYDAAGNRVTRTMMASLLVHEVRPTIPEGSDGKTVNNIMNVLMDFGIGEDDCVYTAYWDAANPVVCSDKDVLVSVYRRGKKLLAVCGGWADGDRDVVLSLKRGGFFSAKNAEAGAVLAVSGGKVRFRLAKHDLALVELE